MKETALNLVEVSVQEAASKVGRSFHQLEKADKVVAVDCSKCVHSKLHLGGIAHLVTELLHFAVWTKSVRRYFFTV